MASFLDEIAILAPAPRPGIVRRELCALGDSIQRSSAFGNLIQRSGGEVASFLDEIVIVPERPAAGTVRRS